MTDLGDGLRDLSALLLALHERARELGYREQQRFTMERLREAIPFDAGLLGMGIFPRGAPPVAHDVWLFERPLELMESWERIKTRDPAAAHSTSRPGVTLNVAVDGPLFDGLDDARAHCHAFGIAHILTTAIVSAANGLYWVMSLYREDPERPFSEAERVFKEAVTPHVFSAAREARLGQLRRVAQVSSAHGQTAAIVNEHGTVLEAEPDLPRLLRLEWPGWEGPELPRALADEVERGAEGVARHGPLVIRIDAADGVRLLHARRTVPADSLTAREREIAEGFSLGETHRELGERLGISPNTVRRHLANIYEKLGVSSKVELDRMLSSG